MHTTKQRGLGRSEVRRANARRPVGAGRRVWIRQLLDAQPMLQDGAESPLVQLVLVGSGSSLRASFPMNGSAEAGRRIQQVIGRHVESSFHPL